MRRGQNTNLYWRRNEQIRSETLRVIGPDGKQIGIIRRSEALEKARELELDLVEIAPKANPAVAKIIDYSKFLYEQEKKQRQERKRRKKGETLKEMWFTPFIADNDYATRFERVEEFLAGGAKVRITVRPKRRLFDTKPLFNVMNRVLKDTEELAHVEQEPKILGRQLIAVIAPDLKGAGKETPELNEENQNES
ncbi:translation initiation factor IF-3 [Candidatus Microgenomates bacterium]|nr:translation initiation factor IF-3 [Candidatus Microgenomates bacterium]